MILQCGFSKYRLFGVTVQDQNVQGCCVKVYGQAALFFEPVKKHAILYEIGYDYLEFWRTVGSFKLVIKL
jgi:hypothetical protein